MNLPELPAGPRQYPPSLERRVTSRGMVLVFGIYLFGVNGILVTAAGISWMSPLFIVIGGTALFLGILCGIIRVTTDRHVGRLLRNGIWGPAKVTRIEPGEKKRKVSYEFNVQGKDLSGVLDEPQPWAEDFRNGESSTVLYDSDDPTQNLLLSRDNVEVMCETWGLKVPEEHARISGK